MDKIKVDISGAADVFQTDELTVGGNTITMRNHIPIADKIAMAQELTTFFTDVNEETETVQRDPFASMARVYLVVKYYTNVDIDGLSPSEVYDWIINNDAWERVEEFVRHDLWEVDEFADQIFINVQDTFNAEHSLSKAVKQSFGFLFNGEDITETLAKSRILSEEMVDIIGRLNQSQQKSENGTVKVGGNVISIGKKQ